jgi:hypothetical protein
MIPGDNKPRVLSSSNCKRGISANFSGSVWIPVRHFCAITEHDIGNESPPDCWCPFVLHRIVHSERSNDPEYCGDDPLEGSYEFGYASLKFVLDSLPQENSPLAMLLPPEA